MSQPAYPITWSAFYDMVHWTVETCLEDDPDVAMTWKGAAKSEEDAQAQALRDTAIAIRAATHLACVPIQKDKARVKILRSGRRIDDSDDFHLVVAKGHAITYLEMARSEKAYRMDLAEKARDCAHALGLIAASLCELMEAGTLHISYGTLDERNSDSGNSFIFDGHVVPDRGDQIFLRGHWPDAFNAAIMATSLLYGLCGGDHNEGQARYQIPGSATLRAQERYAIRIQAPQLITGPIEVLKLCGLEDEAQALRKAFGFGASEIDETDEA